MNRILLVSALLFLPSLGAAGQETPRATFGEAVEVRVVNLAVQVTDSDGVPIDDLHKGDFELRVDGKPVEISNFSQVNRPVAGTPTVSTPSASAAASKAPATTTAPKPYLIVWLDDLHLIPAHRNRTLRALTSLLEDQEKLGVEVGIVRFDQNLRVLRAPGDRSRPIAHVLAEEERSNASGLLSESARRATFEQIEDLYAQSRCRLVESMDAMALGYAEQLRSNAMASIGAMRDFLASLAGLRGRRVLLFVSDALPIEPGDEAYLYVDQLCQPSDNSVRNRPRYLLTQELHDLSAAANEAGVTVYSYQAGGLPAATDPSTFGGGLDAGNLMLARNNDQDAFVTLASDTGGRALLNSNDVEPLVEGMQSDWSNYYSLGFTPSGPADGKEHTVEVRVKRAGVKVRSPRSFFDRPAGAARTDRLLALLRFGGRAQNPLGVRVEVAKAKPAGKQRIELPFRLLVPASSLVFVPGERGVAHLEIVLAVSDDRGRTAPLQKRALTVDRTKLAKDLSRAVLRIPFDLELRRGPVNVAISVRDVFGDTTSFLEHSLDLR